MPIIQVIFILIVIGVILYLVNRYVPMDAKIKTILNWTVVIIVILWLLNLFGIFTGFNGGPRVG